MQFKTAVVIAALMQTALATPVNLPDGQHRPSIRTDVADTSRLELTSRSLASSNLNGCKQPQGSIRRRSKNLIRRNKGTFHTKLECLPKKSVISHANQSAIIVRQALNNINWGNVCTTGMNAAQHFKEHLRQQMNEDEKNQKLKAEEQQRKPDEVRERRPPSPPKQAQVVAGSTPGASSPPWMSSH